MKDFGYGNGFTNYGKKKLLAFKSKLPTDWVDLCDVKGGTYWTETYVENISDAIAHIVVVRGDNIFDWLLGDIAPYFGRDEIIWNFGDGTTATLQGLINEAIRSHTNWYLIKHKLWGRIRG